MTSCHNFRGKMDKSLSTRGTFILEQNANKNRQKMRLAKIENPPVLNYLNPKSI